MILHLYPLLVTFELLLLAGICAKCERRQNRMRDRAFHSMFFAGIFGFLSICQFIFGHVVADIRSVLFSLFVTLAGYAAEYKRTIIILHMAIARLVQLSSAQSWRLNSFLSSSSVVRSPSHDAKTRFIVM